MARGPYFYRSTRYLVFLLCHSFKTEFCRYCCRCCRCRRCCRCCRRCCRPTSKSKKWMACPKLKHMFDEMDLINFSGPSLLQRKKPLGWEIPWWTFYFRNFNFLTTVGVLNELGPRYCGSVGRVSFKGPSLMQLYWRGFESHRGIRW